LQNKFDSVVKNLLVVSVVTILLAHSVLSLYAEAFFCGDSPLECSFKDFSQPDILSFTEEGSDILYQFIFDSEFRNINASTTVFEEHKNLNSEMGSNPVFCTVFSFPLFLAGMNFSPKLLSIYHFLPNNCKQALYSNLFCFRI
jgi:hypothetical protein